MERLLVPDSGGSLTKSKDEIRASRKINFLVPLLSWNSRTKIDYLLPVRAFGGEAVMTTAPLNRRLLAILAVDVVGYSRLMDQDESGTIARLQTVRTEVISLCPSSEPRTSI